MHALRSRRHTALGLLLAALAGQGALCAPDMEWHAPPEFLVFDVESDPPRIPEPNNLLLNRDTGRLDFSQVGVDLPPHPRDCVGFVDLSVAQCEFDLYLQGLDGFPSLSPLKAPVSALLDPATVTATGDAADNVVVLDASTMTKVTDLEVTLDDATGDLRISRAAGWDLGRTYVAAVRGYDHGVRGSAGERVVASWVYLFLRQAESLLSCRPDPPDPQELEEPIAAVADCKYFEFFLDQVDSPAEAVDALRALETLRRDLQVDGVWSLLPSAGAMAPEEAAVAWAFRVHSAAVPELDPSTDRVPEVLDDQRIYVPVRGSLDASSLSASSLDVPPYLASTVLLLDLTALEADDYEHGFPAFTVGVVAGGLELRVDAPLLPGNRYGLLLTTSDGAPGSRAAVRDLAGVPIVPSPVTVLLRSRGAIADVDGKSLVSSASDEDAVELEEGRQTLRPLLDNAFFMDLADLTRENVAYLYGFEIQ